MDAILEAAARIFDGEGHRATTNRIAECAGVSIGSLYQYFPDKAALITALHQRHTEDVATLTIRVLAEGGTVERLVAELVALHRARPNLQRLLHADSGRLAGGPLEREAKQRFFVFVAAWLRERAPHRAGAEVEAAARTVMMMGEGLIHGCLDEDRLGIPAEALTAEIDRALIAYVDRWAAG